MNIPDDCGLCGMSRQGPHKNSLFGNGGSTAGPGAPPGNIDIELQGGNSPSERNVFVNGKPIR